MSSAPSVTPSQFGHTLANRRGQLESRLRAAPVDDLVGNLVSGAERQAASQLPALELATRVWAELCPPELRGESYPLHFEPGGVLIVAVSSHGLLPYARSKAAGLRARLQAHLPGLNWLRFTVGETTEITEAAEPAEAS